MYALFQVFIMVERFAVVEVAGLGAGDTVLLRLLGLLTAAKSRNFRKIPPAPLPPPPPHTHAPLKPLPAWRPPTKS